MRKVISFCVYGDADIYNYGIYENAILAPKIFPGWIMVVYYTNTVNKKVFEELAKFSWVELELYDLPNHHKNTMLRFIPAFELKNDVVIFRDADSRLIKRDYIAVMDWLENSKKNVHVMRDHPVNQSDIMAGMWGVRNKILAKPEIVLKFWTYFNDPEYKKWTVDQKYLAKYIYPLVINDTRIHAEFNRKEKWATSFPKNAPKRNFGFIGMTIRRMPNSVKTFNILDIKYDKKRVKNSNNLKHLKKKK